MMTMEMMMKIRTMMMTMMVGPDFDGIMWYHMVSYGFIWYHMIS